MKLTLKYLKESAARKAYNGLTRLRAWWPIVNQNFIDIETAINTLGDDISTEAEARKEADKRLIGEFEDFGEFIASSDDEDGVFNATDAEGLSNIPTERLFKLRNNTNSTITTLQLNPDLYTLSTPVMKDQEVICLKSNQTGERKRKIIVFNEDIASLEDIKDALAAEVTAREEADVTLRTDIDGLQKSVFGEEKEYTATLAYHYDNASYSFAVRPINIQDDTAFDGFILTLTDSDGIQLTLDSNNMPNGWLVDWSLTLADTETARSVYLFFDTGKKRIWFGTVNGINEDGFRIGDCGGDPGDYWLDFLPPAGEVIKQTVTPSLSNLATKDKSNILSAVNELVNTYAEVLNWIATHGTDFAALVGQVNTNTGKIATLETNMPASATAAEIREAWNPTPVTPTVTITGQYGYPDTLTISDESDMNKLLALEEGEAFTLIISATDVEQSGNSKWLEHIRSFTYPATSPGYDISSVTLWDNEVGTFTMFECIMRAQTTLTDGVRTFGTIDVTSY